MVCLRLSRLVTMICFFVISTNGLSQSFDKIDSILNESRKLSAIQNDSLLYFTTLSFDLSLKEPYRLGIFESIDLKGRYLMAKNSLKESLNVYEEAVVILDSLGYNEELALVHDRIGRINIKIGKYNKSQSAYLSGLKIRESVGDSVGLLGSYNNLGRIYGILKNHSLALDYFNKGLKIAHALGNGSYLTSFYGNLGLTYLNLNQQQEAFENLKTCLEFKISRNSKPASIAVSYHNLGLAYERYEIYDSSLYYYNMALEIRKKNGDDKILADTYNNLGYVYYKIGDLNKSLRFYEISEALAHKYSKRYLQRKIFSNLSRLYHDLGDYKNSYNYLFMYDTLNQSIP